MTAKVPIGKDLAGAWLRAENVGGPRRQSSPDRVAVDAWISVVGVGHGANPVRQHGGHGKIGHIDVSAQVPRAVLGNSIDTITPRLHDANVDGPIGRANGIPAALAQKCRTEETED